MLVTNTTLRSGVHFMTTSSLTLFLHPASSFWMEFLDMERNRWGFKNSPKESTSVMRFLCRKLVRFRAPLAQRPGTAMWLFSLGYWRVQTSALTCETLQPRASYAFVTLRLDRGKKISSTFSTPYLMCGVRCQGRFKEAVQVTGFVQCFVTWFVTERNC